MQHKTNDQEQTPLLPGDQKLSSLPSSVASFLREHLGAEAADPIRIDVARFLLMIFVVVGHFIEPFYKIGSPAAWCIEVWIYSFHIPAFILLSGYVSGEIDSRRRRQMIMSLVAPYIIFQILFCNWYKFAYYVHHDGHTPGMFTRDWQVWAPYPEDPSMAPSFWIGGWFVLQPFAHLWYLVTLLSQRVLRPWALELKFSAALLFVAGCLVGYTRIGRALSLHRTITLMPYFLVGFLMKKHRCFFPRARSKTQAISAAILVVTSFIMTTFGALFGGLKVEIFFLSDPNDVAYGPQYSAYGALFAAAQYAWAFVLMAAVFLLIPTSTAAGVADPPGHTESSAGTDGHKRARLRERDQKSAAAVVFLRCAKYGARTIHPYILHFAVLMVLETCGFYDFTWDVNADSSSMTMYLRLLAAVILALVTTVALSLRTGSPMLCHYILQPDLSCIFEEPEEVLQTEVLPK